MANTAQDVRCSDLDGKPPESTDFANYFCTYAYLYHQKDMLEDHKRTGAYYQAVKSNRRQFQGKVVLDVGTGSGILSIFAAHAGASKVYAVEATSMAHHARKLVTHNKLDHVIEVIQGTIETISLPEQVDIIISEWMGYFLLRESMLDSVIIARDKFLKPGGALYPSHATLYLAPIKTHVTQQRMSELQGAMEGWANFTREVRQYYNVDMDCLSENFHSEQREYYQGTSAWSDVHPSQLVGNPAPFMKYDLLNVTLDELKAPLRQDFSLYMLDNGWVDAFVGFFDVDFKGSPQNPADIEVKLSTAPDPTGATHWGQQCFFLYPPLECHSGDVLASNIEISRRKDNHRLLHVKLTTKCTSGPSGVQAPRTFEFNID